MRGDRGKVLLRSTHMNMLLEFVTGTATEKISKSRQVYFSAGTEKTGYPCTVPRTCCASRSLGTLSGQSAGRPCLTPPMRK